MSETRQLRFDDIEIAGETSTQLAADKFKEM